MKKQANITWKHHLLFIFLLFQLAATLTGVPVDAPNMKEPLFLRKEKKTKIKHLTDCLKELETKENIINLKDPYPICRNSLHTLHSCSLIHLLYAEKLYLLFYALREHSNSKNKSIITEAKNIIRFCPKERIHQEIEYYLKLP